MGHGAHSHVPPGPVAHLPDFGVGSRNGVCAEYAVHFAVHHDARHGRNDHRHDARHPHAAAAARDQKALELVHHDLAVGAHSRHFHRLRFDPGH